MIQITRDQAYKMGAMVNHQSRKDTYFVQDNGLIVNNYGKILGGLTVEMINSVDDVHELLEV